MSSSSSSEEMKVEDSDDSSSEEEEEEEEDPLKLEPPTFSLPVDGDFELWTIRMPINVDLDALNGMKLSLDKKQLGVLKSKDKKYGVVLGEPFETESFRVLVEQDGEFLVPTKVPIAKHLNIVHADALKEIKQTDLAPGIERAPTPVGPVRKAYSVVPQKSGLKRRWMPPGLPPTDDVSRTDKAKQLISGLSFMHSSHVQAPMSGGAVEVRDASPIKSPPPKKRQRKVETDDEIDDDAVQNSPATNGTSVVKLELDEEATPQSSSKKVKKETKEEKQARKTEKKAKKESKKAKKEKRKSKD
jgi:hypothetical protein